MQALLVPRCQVHYGCPQQPSTVWVSKGEDSAADLNDAFRDPGVRTISSTRGGKGAYQIAHILDFDAVGAEAPHHKACKAQPNEEPPGLRREEIRHPCSPGGLVAGHYGRCGVAVEIEVHCDERFLAGSARGGKHRTRSGPINA